MPGLHLAFEVTVAAACTSVVAVLLILALRRRDLLDPRTGLLLGAVLVSTATVLLLPAAGALGLPAAHGDILGAAAAITAIGGAIGLWPWLPRVLALGSPALLSREVQVRREAERRALDSETRARASEARTTAFLANLPEALFVLRVAGDGTLFVETLNPAFERMFGVEGEKLIGGPAEAMLPAPLLAITQPRWREAAERGEPLDYEVTADLPAGRRSWQTVLVPMRGADGRVERLLGSARDITATRRLQQGLVQSARLATVGTMCAGLAHEASQPLNAAALWLRRVTLSVRSLPDAERIPVTRAVQVVDDQLRRAADLVVRIRALAGEEPMEAERFDATAAVAAALRTATTHYAAEGITVTLSGAGAPLAVLGNPSRLEQAVLQLLANARDAVLDRRRHDPAAPARIEVGLRRAAGAVLVEVRDSGTGVPEMLAGVIFDPFFTTKEPGRGSGLGLSFAAAVARAMGGGIETWNLPEGGACFRMELAAAQPVAPRTDTGAGPGAELSPPRGAELSPPRGAELSLPRGAELSPPRGAELSPPRGAELSPARGAAGSRAPGSAADARAIVAA